MNEKVKIERLEERVDDNKERISGGFPSAKWDSIFIFHILFLYFADQRLDRGTLQACLH